MNEEIKQARISLRKIYDKYNSELFEVMNKIDKMLETLEDGN